MNEFIGMKKLRRRLAALLLAAVTAVSFVPTVLAESPSDLETTQSSATVSSSATTTATTAAASSAVSSAPAKAVSGSGFENVQSDGGTMMVGTARIPKADGSYATVKFVYSSGINLNDKSLTLINAELNVCGVTIPDGMIYVSRSDIVSDSQLMTQTSERQAVFACGSESAPTVLKAYPPYESVEESFEHLFRGYIFTITGYSSLKPVLEGRSEVVLSDDGQTATTSIVMSEDYVEKVINGKKVKILMINSELKYYFRAPKLNFEKDQNYVASASDIEYHYPSHATTETTVPTLYVNPSSEENQVPEDMTTTQPSDTSTTEAVKPTSHETTEPEATTASTTEPTTASTTESTTEPTTTSTTESTTEPTTASTTSATKTTTTTALEEEEPTTTKKTTTTTAPTLPTTTQSTTDGSAFEHTTLPNSLSSNRAFVNTRRLPLNIRSGPGLNYMIVTVLPKGTYVTVLDTSNPDWYLIRTMNRTVGYAYSYYIKIDE